MKYSDQLFMLLRIASLLFATNCAAACAMQIRVLPEPLSRKLTRSGECMNAQVVDELTTGDAERRLISNEVFEPLVDSISILWFSSIPLEAKPPQNMPGSATVVFTVTSNGTVQGVRLLNTRGRAPIIRGIWKAIGDAKPIRFPVSLHRETLSLRFEFAVNSNCTP